MKVDDFQMDILKYIWNQYIESFHWPKCYKVHQQFDLKRDEVLNALCSLGGGVVQEVIEFSNECYYQLTALGAVIASGGDLFYQSVKLIELLKKRIQNGKFYGKITSGEMREEIGCNGYDSHSLAKFAYNFLPYHTSMQSMAGEECTMTYHEDIDRLLSVTDVWQYIENMISSKCDLQRPFYHEDRKLYNSQVIYSPKKLNLGYDRLLINEAINLGNLLTIPLAIVLGYIVIAAWVPAVRPFSAGADFGILLKTIISIVCALTGIGFTSSPLHFRKKIIDWKYSRSTRRAIILAEEGSFEELLEKEKLIRMIWDRLKRTGDQI